MAALNWTTFKTSLLIRIARVLTRKPVKGPSATISERVPALVSNDTKSSEKCIKVVHFSVFATPRQIVYLKINALEKIDVKSSCLVDRWAAEFREVG